MYFEINDEIECKMCKNFVEFGQIDRQGLCHKCVGDEKEYIKALRTKLNASIKSYQLACEVPDIMILDLVDFADNVISDQKRLIIALQNELRNTSIEKRIYTVVKYDIEWNETTVVKSFTYKHKDKAYLLQEKLYERAKIVGENNISYDVYEGILED